MKLACSFASEVRQGGAAAGLGIGARLSRAWIMHVCELGVINLQQRCR